jgi:hypothetical protein
MRVAAWVRGLLAVGVVLASGAAARADDPPSLVLAKQAVEKARGEKHREKMRVHWPDVADETPPDGAEVLLVRGYISYELTRFVVRGAKVEAGSVSAARSWFYNRKGESFGAMEFDVDRDRFVTAWNAMRRILAASDERVAPAPEDHENGGSFMSGSHQSADWICARTRADAAPVHCADRPSSSYDWDDVRTWDGLRDRAIFDTFESLIPDRDTGRRPAAVAAWAGFAAAEIRHAAKALDVERVRRDDEFLDACLRVLGEAGDEASEADVAALDAALAKLDATAYPVESARDELSRAATRLRLRLHWSREEVVRALREGPQGTWAREDQAKWLRETFRAKDPEGWAAFLIEETSRPGADPDHVAAAAAELRRLPAEQAAPILRTLIARDDPYVRLEAALALHGVAPDDPLAKSAVTALALDRSIACDWRPDLTDRWSRNRALAAALEWGALTPKELRAHFVAPLADDPEFLETLRERLTGTPEALSDEETRDAWRRLLDEKSARRVLAAVRFLVDARDVASKDRMLAALDAIAGAEGTDADALARWRGHVEALGAPADDVK